MFKTGFRCSLVPARVLSWNSRRQFSVHNGSKLEGKIALITGAASGIGKETAAKFITNGAKVVLADVQKELGHETARELGPNASFIPCDVTKESDISEAVDFTVTKHGHLNIMYNNAGIACQTPPSIINLNMEAFDRVMAINVRGILTGIKHGARIMIPRQQGVILCTASVTGITGGLSQHTYSISKASVIGIVKSVASELCKHGIRINCISPMAIPTPFAMDELMKYYPGVEPEKLIKIVNDFSVLKGSVCETSDIANAAVYLACDEAKFVNGHNLVVDGGFTSFKSLDFPTPDQLK